MSQQTHRGAEVLHGLPTANRTDATDETYTSPTQEIIASNKIWHQDQKNPCRTQSIRLSWLKVTRLFHSANIALELFRICSKGILPFFIIRTTVADQRLLLALINTLANMRETYFCSASTLDERIKLGHGHWCGSHVGSCFKSLLCPDNGLHIRDILKNRNRLYHWYETISQNRPT